MNSITENIIYTGTVFNLKVKVDEDNLTKESNFDLCKIQGLRVIDNGFLKILRIDYNKTQKDIAKLAEVPLRTLIGWESYHKAMPFNKLMLLTKKLGLENFE